MKPMPAGDAGQALEEFILETLRAWLAIPGPRKAVLRFRAANGDSFRLDLPPRQSRTVAPPAPGTPPAGSAATFTPGG